MSSSASGASGASWGSTSKGGSVSLSATASRAMISAIVTQSVEDSDGVSVEPWDGPAPSPDLAGHVTDAAASLLASLRAILPYAVAHAEHQDNISLPPAADGIFADIDAAKALLASLDGSTDAEGAAHG